MKKFHKRAAVFLTAATLAGLPAGAFFYSSPGSLTVWADNVEVESSEESSPEDVDFSDGSEAEILADPVEQAQEDAGNDVTETPEVGITFTEPEGWQTDTATVKIQVEDTKNTGAFSIAKVEARLSENGGWSDITGNMEVSISSNCSVYVRVTDQNGNTYEQNRYIECFDKTKPTIIAAAKNGILIVQGVDAESGIAALYVNGNEFTELTNNTLNVRLHQSYYVHRNRNTYMRVLRLKFPAMENYLLHLERKFFNMDGKKWKNGSLNHMGKTQKDQKMRKVIFQI